MGIKILVQNSIRNTQTNIIIVLIFVINAFSFLLLRAGPNSLSHSRLKKETLASQTNPNTPD